MSAPRRLDLVAAQALRILAALALLGGPLGAQATQRVGDLVTPAGSIPRRVIGYGLVIGLEGTGDRSFGTANGGTQTVRSIANALRRFGLEVPAERLRPRNVAAVVVTAEMSPYLRAGGRFPVEVSSIGDATSLRGGVLWMTPLVGDVSQAPVATAQGPLLLADQEVRYAGRRGNSGRIPEGGVLEVDPATIVALTPKLLLRQPGLATAQRVAQAINQGLGDSAAARVDDPGSITLNPGTRGADNLIGFLAAVDTLPVRMVPEDRIVIDARSGTVVAGGNVRVAAATVSHRGLTLRIGGPTVVAAAPADSGRSAPTEGLLAVGDGATVQEVAAGLHAAGAKADEIAAMFRALHDVGAIGAEVVVR
ncbi:MAG: flagellar basal body P-ring protein FlgI [Gemmatimonadetes bacterium]|nr:flagellar basal body P-ring protein FlgI [Gemmatimonadota bacterium]MBK7349385.1 flagellar basal body P-ring protein FlgI [Gemmatimonadota bacterium]MBK9067938.1 flagellar basal body P-ring protein FlgI [Gemmatimonadota bacterium]